MPDNLLKPVSLVTHPELYESLAEHIGSQPVMWDDRVRTGTTWGVQNATLHFIQIYNGVDTLTFDIANGGGVISFARIQKNWRAQCYVAAWSRDAIMALREQPLIRNAAQAAVMTHNLLVIDAFVHPKNVLGRKCSKRNGMQLRGIIKHAMWYNGGVENVYWFEITREELGVPPE